MNRRDIIPMEGERKKEQQKQQQHIQRTSHQQVDTYFNHAMTTRKPRTITGFYLW